MVSGATCIVGVEDDPFWRKDERGVVRLPDMRGVPETEVLVLAEVLQKVEDPVATLKEAAAKAPKLLIVVPNEWSWDPKFKPFTNPEHKWSFDSESLAKALEAAGLQYTIGLIEFGGWSFLNAEATRT